MDFYLAEGIHTQSPVGEGDPGLTAKFHCGAYGPYLSGSVTLSSCKNNLCTNWQQKQVKLLDEDQVGSNHSAPLYTSAVCAIGLVNFGKSVCWTAALSLMTSSRNNLRLVSCRRF